MTDKRIEQFIGFLRHTGEEVRAEAQRLLVDLRDPDKQQRVKEGVRELGSWARQTVDDVADIVEKAVRRAEDALNDAAAKVGVRVPGTRREEPGVSATEVSPPLEEEEPSADAPVATARKTVGRRSAAKKASKPTARKKTVGRKKK
jgi:hypothetical protein